MGIEVAGNNQRPPLAAVQLNTPKMEITNTRMRSDTWRIVSGKLYVRCLIKSRSRGYLLVKGPVQAMSDSLSGGKSWRR